AFGQEDGMLSSISDVNLEKEMQDRESVVIVRNKFYRDERQESKSNENLPDHTLPTIAMPEKSIIKEKSEDSNFKQRKKRNTEDDNSYLEKLEQKFKEFMTTTRKDLNSGYFQLGVGSNLGVSPKIGASFSEFDNVAKISRNTFSSSPNYDPFFAFGGAFGYSFIDYARAELEYRGVIFGRGSHMITNELSINNGANAKNFKYDDLGFISGMHSINFNMFFDTNRRHRIYFSLGGGLGPTFINFQNQSINGDVTINYNAIFQCNVRLTDHILVYAEYRYTFVQGRDYSLSKPITVVNYASTDTPALADNRSIRNNSLSLDSFAIHTFFVGARIYLF
ncbi:MAG: hypothetical protein RL208_395, partial [Pseudomonadota bacterium]